MTKKAKVVPIKTAKKNGAADPKDEQQTTPEAESGEAEERTTTAEAQPKDTGAEHPQAAAANAGQPETDPSDDDEGPSLDDLMPGLGEAIEKAEADERAALEARVASLEAEKADMRDRMLRALADAENTRRRAERDRKDAESYGGTRLARDLLAVHDNLARALGAADDEMRNGHAAFFEGLELTQRELLKAFEKHKINKVEPEKGEKFDPNRHQAMFEAAIPGAPNGTIIEVMASGFMIADRLLRPAMVGVARGVPPAAKAPDPEPEAKATPEAGPEDSEAAAEPEAKAAANDTKG